MVQDNKIMLNSFVVEDINKGGSILNVSRGGLDIRLAEKVLLKYNIRQLYVIGGDGTLTACDKLIKYFRTVHGMMFGYTDFCTGMVNNHSCYIPIKYILQNSPRKLISMDVRTNA
jgi:6-phosphofructokinase